MHKGGADMTFTIEYASDWEYQSEKTFNSLEELREFSISEGHRLIVDFDRMVIVVYDYWVE